MSEASTARDRILQNIRGAHGPQPTKPQITATYGDIPRDYHSADSLSLENRVELFEERLREYDAGVYRATSASLAAVIARVLMLREKHHIAVPTGVPAAWLPDGTIFVTDADTISTSELNTLDGVLTGCTIAIALTGTIVLQNAPAQGPRKLSLVPDYHLCVVFQEQVVGTVPEAFERLAATSTLPTTFISGPSATADIEMTRIKGVHGPRFFDVIVVK